MAGRADESSRKHVWGEMKIPPSAVNFTLPLGRKMNLNKTNAKKFVITYLVAFAGLAQAKSGEVIYINCFGGEILKGSI